MKILAILTLIIFELSGSSLPPFKPSMSIENTPLSKLKIQNRQIVKSASEALSQGLPKRVDRFTSLESVKAKDTTLTFVFSLNVPNKSDEALEKEGKKRMRDRVTRGVCGSYKRFLDADIKVAYHYISAKSKKELFSFSIDKNKCKEWEIEQRSKIFNTLSK